MKIALNPGKYVVAVSGGVDSVVLLDVLSKQSDIDLVVAHLDHGIRKDSKDDAEFVRDLSDQYGYKFEAEEARLGADASEEQARKARYEFLKEIMKKHSAKAIVTAHHQDDLLETAAINLFRGTGRKGISSLKSRPGLIRPFLDKSKKQIINYAKRNNLRWREDPSNLDQRYLRNYLRHEILPKMSKDSKAHLIETINNSSARNDEIDRELDQLLDINIDEDEISRRWIASLPHSVTKELLAHWLRKHQIYFDNQLIERLSIQLKTAKPNARLNVSGNWFFESDSRLIRLVNAK